MGQKIHPKGYRVGPVFTWVSRWFADKRLYRSLLYEDVKIREDLFRRLKSAGLSEVEIERSINKIKIILHVARPGVVIGRGGSGLEEIKKYLERFIADLAKTRPGRGDAKQKLELSVEPVKEPNLQAYLVATTIADQLVKRLPHKRVGNQAIERVMSAGAKGVRVILSGRIAGAEIARREKYQAGTVPLSTIREEIDFASVPALTKSGYIGVKVWICRKS
ncbi:30S ribosomal protein S3 [Candidatus Gottesmanbacteria bacterium]|nr:30S ribosomal protein S3 [Candidatus Gottesmanbacteria bacterium]